MGVLAATDADDQPPPPKKIALALMKDIQRSLHESKRESRKASTHPHGMSGTVSDGPAPPSPNGPARAETLPSGRASPRSVSEVPQARAVVVLHAHSTTGQIRRSHGFCIDSKQLIVVGGAHTLPREVEHLAFVAVHVYDPEEDCFAPRFVAQPLQGGVSAIFQDGGMDLALLRITHRYDADAADKRGAEVDGAPDLGGLAAMPIGSTGYEPRDQVSVIRFPIIEADSSRGCKPKCGRVIARVDSRLHLDFTELQDGDSGALVINGAGEAIAFLMGRPPNRQSTACRCVKVVSESGTISTPDNSVYYAQLL